MTIETRGTIEPKDIVAVEMECSRCHAKITRSMRGEMQAMHIPTGCDNCDNIWMIGNDSEFIELGRLITLIHRHAQKQNGKDTFTLRFEVAGLVEQTKK